MKNTLPSRSVGPRGRFVVLFAALLALVPAAEVRAQNLVFHYGFDEGAGTAVSDTAGDYDLALRSTTTWGAGVNGATGGLSLNATAMGLPGAGASGLFSGEGEAINLTKFTFTGWYQVSGTPSGTLLSLNNTTAGSSFRITFEAGNKFILYTQGRNITSTSSSVISGSPGEWVFVAVSVDTTLATPGTNWANAVKVHVGNTDSIGLTHIGNGGLTGSQSLSASALGGIDQIVIGNNNGTTASAARALNANALLDEFRLYDGVLDNAALDSIRLQSIPEPKTSAVAAGAGALCVVLMRRRKSRV